MSTNHTTFDEGEKRQLNKRMEAIAWGLFLIVIGGLWLVPGELVPQGTWLLGTGLIMLGLNAARYFNGIRMSGLTIVLGSIALLAGCNEALRADLPLFAILLILVGAAIILKPSLPRR